MPTVNRTNIILRPNSSRVLLRAFQLTSELRIRGIIKRALSLCEQESDDQLAEIYSEFEDRHKDVDQFFDARFDATRQFLPTDEWPVGTVPGESCRRLIGAYFTQEYALEAAALFNPSMIWHPDNSGVPDGYRRFILSLRATGEGHISSIVFRSGTVGPGGSIQMDTPSRFVTTPNPVPDSRYHLPLFSRTLQEMGWWSDYVVDVLTDLPEWFTLAQLRDSLTDVGRGDRMRERGNMNIARAIETLALANYEIQFQPDQELSERVIFPFSPAEMGGIEDARFVEFINDDGSHRYYATYTAYDGRTIMPQIIETDDFLHFKVNTLNGPEVHNKGMALFPRKINGRFMMLGRQDNENIYLMESDSLHFWHEKRFLLGPKAPWEFIQLGNCGSPIELDEGWLVISHGVGPMRKYSIGAFLLDKDDPSKVIARLKEPLLTPNASEREGYVPNVVYSCGGLVHEGVLILPFAMSDSASSFMTVNLDELLSSMTREK